MASRLGVKVNVRKVAVKAFDEPRPYRDPAVADDHGLAERGQRSRRCDVVAELAGGTTVARTMILAALKLGKPVVTANKALLSAHGEELFAAARAIRHEPLLRSQRRRRHSHHQGPARRLRRQPHHPPLRHRQRHLQLHPHPHEAGGRGLCRRAGRRAAQGYAEAEPSLDIDGYDALHKIGILASLAHGFWVKPEAHPRRRHPRDHAQLDIQFADQLGYTIKLLGIVKKVEGQGERKAANAPACRCRSIPTLVPNAHVLASVNDVFNAVFVRGDVVGDTLFYGRGAGKDATASAVLSDLADAALDLKFGTKHRVPPFVPHERDGAVLPMDEVVSRYYVRLSVVDRPGVLAKIAAILGGPRSASPR